MNKLRLWVRGLGVPTYHKVSYRGTKLRVKPLGWRRFFRAYPYSQGGRVCFRVESEPKEEGIPPIAIFEDIPLAESSKKERHPLLMSTFREVMSGDIYQRLDVQGSVMSVSGHGRYTVGNPDKEDEIEIVTFDIKRDATMFMWMLPSILALVSIIVSAILWLRFPPKTP